MFQLKVGGMTCSHCVAAITRAVQAIPSAGAVRVDLEHGDVTVEGEPDRAAVRAAIEAEGYTVAT
jgi:copper chaperone